MLRKIKLLYILLVIPLITPIPVFATGGTPTYTSTNYSANQVFFGSGGCNPTGTCTSANYKAQVSIGETGVGNYTSANYQAHAGFDTTAAPFLEAVVTSANLNLGVLSTASTATGTGTFYVRAWDSSGYIVQTNSVPPTSITTPFHAFATNSTPTSPTVGVEQFGMNLVKDTIPASLTTASPVSADPLQNTVYPNVHPTNDIAYGAAFGNYATTNKYSYTNGDIIAKSLKSTSSTIYVLSYIFNISNATPDGQYVFNDNLVVTAGY